MSNWTTADIPDQTGRTAVITGANTGLGYETAAALAAKGAQVVLAVRNLDKGSDAADRIDQGRARRRRRRAGTRPQRRCESVRAAADELRSSHDTIDLLINNAGVMYTAEGDHQGRFRVAVRHQPLGPLRVHRSAARPHTGDAGFTRGHGQQQSATASRAAIHFDDLQWERNYSRVGAYGQSKLANLMFTYELQRRLAGHQHHRRWPRTPAARTPNWPATCRRWCSAP